VRQSFSIRNGTNGYEFGENARTAQAGARAASAGCQQQSAALTRRKKYYDSRRKILGRVVKLIVQVCFAAVISLFNAIAKRQVLRRGGAKID